MKRPSVPFGYCIFADDVRREDTGKNIVIGAYNDAILINAPLPFQMPLAMQICLFLPNDRNADATMSIVLDKASLDGNLLVRVDMPIDTGFRESAHAFPAHPDWQFFSASVKLGIDVSELCILRTSMQIGGETYWLGEIAVLDRPAAAQRGIRVGQQ